MTKPKAYSYLRFSTPDQIKGDSLRRQQEAAITYASANNLDLDENLSFQDLGVSAFTGGNRDAKLGAFMAAVEDGSIKPGSYLLVEALDRLSRERVLTALGQLADIVKAGITVVTLQDNKEYTHENINDPMALMYSIMIMGTAHEESQKKSQRLGAAWRNKRSKAQEGREILTSRAPAWLTVEGSDFVINEERAEVIRRIFDMTIQGSGKARIAKTLNKECVETFGRSEGWHPSYVQKILDSEAVIGTFQPHRTTKDEVTGKKKRVPDGDPIENYFPTIVDRSTFLKAHETRSSRFLPRGKTGKRFSNIFTGLAVCGECGASMHFINKGSGWTYLQCSNARRKAGNCTNPPIRYGDLERGILLEGVEYIDFREVYPKTHERLSEAVKELEGRELILQNDLEKTKSALDNIVNAISQRPDSRPLLDRLDNLEQEEQQISEELEIVTSQLETERVRIDHLARDFESISAALKEWMKEQETADEDRAYLLRSRLNQVLKRVVDRIEFEDGSATIFFLEPKTLGKSEPIDGYHIPQLSWS